MIKKSILLFTQSAVKRFLQNHAVSLFKFVTMNHIKDTIIKTNRRALYAISTTIMLSVFLSACGGGGGGGGTAAGTTPSINANTTPTFSVSSSRLTFNEDFVPTQSIATVRDASVLTVNQSSTGVVRVNASVNGVSISNIANAFGRTTLTISASNGNLIASTQVVVTVNAINDTPTLTVTSSSISTLGGFAPITIGITAHDVEQGTLTFTVEASTLGVVRVNTLANAILLDAITGVSGQTILTVRVSDNAGLTVTQTIAVDVTIRSSIPPELMISTNRIIVLEDFTSSVVITATATDADGGAITLSISSATNLVNAVSSVVSNNRGRITLSSVSNRNGTTTLTVRATDVGGQSTTVEMVVVVTSVNDTPTITVSMDTVTLGSVPIVLNVSASDLEDGILAFSVSSGQNLVRATVTTTNLTISRLDSRVSSIMLTLRTTDTAGATTSTVITVTLSPFFTVTTGIKTLDFNWSALPNATHYQLRSNPDGNSGFVDLTTTGVVVSPNSTMIRQTTAQALVSLRHYIPRASNPQYAVNVCTTTPCGSSFLHNSVALTNAQLNSLIGRLQASNVDAFDYFGRSVNISGDGNTLAVGAPGEQSLSTGVNGAQNDNSARYVGAVYIFRRNGGVWSQQAYIKASNAGMDDAFGGSVYLSDDGNTLAVGADGESGGSTGINGQQDLNNTSDSGAVYVFRFSGGAWSQQVYIKAPNLQSNAQFGSSVSLSGDGNTLAVGEPSNALGNTGVNDVRSVANFPFSGAAYVFRFSGGVWSQQAFIKATNTSLTIRFGYSVSLSSNGNTLAVGARQENGSSTGINGLQSDGAKRSGAAYLFRFSGGVWTQQAYIKASNTQVDAEFGHSVSLSSNGNTLAVGAINEDGSSTGVNGLQDDNSTSTGAVYLFRFSGGVWSQQAYIKASNSGTNDFFGEAVSLSADGNTLAVGADFEDGLASGVGGAENNDDATNSGAVYVFEFRNGTWAQQSYIKSNPSVTNSYFGGSVSFSNDGHTLAVGVENEAGSRGAVYLY